MAQGPTHGHQDHVGWPAVAGERGGGPNREVSAAAYAGEALATMAVMAITSDDDLLAVRAARHATRHYQHHTMSQTPGGGVLTKDVEVYLNPYPLFLRRTTGTPYSARGLRPIRRDYEAPVPSPWASTTRRASG